MHDPVDEERRRAADLAGGETAQHVSTDAVENGAGAAVAVEARRVQSEIDRAGTQIALLERRLIPKEPVVHLPEARLQRRRFGRRGRSKRVRMNLYKGEVPEHEAKCELPLEPLDLAVGRT